MSVGAVWWPQARSGELVAYLDDEEYARLLAATEVAEAGAGDFLLHKGSPSRSVLLVEDGEIEIIDESMGDTVVLGRVGPGGVVGEVGFVDGAARTHHVRAGTACRVRRLTRDALLELARVDPPLFTKVAIGLAELMARRFRTVVAELDPVRVFAATLGEPDESGIEDVGDTEEGEARAPEGGSKAGDGATANTPAPAAAESAETPLAAESAPGDGYVRYDPVGDPLDQAIDILRELARRPGKDLAGV